MFKMCSHKNLQHFGNFQHLIDQKKFKLRCFLVFLLISENKHREVKKTLGIIIETDTHPL